MANKFNKKSYLHRHGLNCSYCDSKDIESITDPMYDGGQCEIIIVCNKCLESWTDVFHLVDVLEDN